jgi:KUP system potassium uptake protein
VTKPETRSRTYLAAATVGAVGVVYGDIGTSPLYAFREAVHAGGLDVTGEEVFGILSLVLWSLTIVVTIKYVIVLMQADNDGEGGILALTSLVAPTSRVGRVSRLSFFVVIGLFGTALLYGDGIITPAISVLSAVEGIQVVAPSLDRFIIPIAVVILVALFAVQRRGTAAIGRVFGPIMIVWFGTIAVLGVVHVTSDPSVMRAFAPTYALQFFLDEPVQAFRTLGAVFLVVTGAEALYADMGHFGKGPIRLGWLAIVFPCLVANYLGQGALLLGDPSAIENPFYLMAPEWAIVPLIVLATAATVIASQALITGAFSLTMQAVQLGYLPRIRIDHTSAKEFGQVYIPAVNYGLMVACVALVVAFGSSANLAAAYGVAVTTTMVITTLLLNRLVRERWHWNPVAATALIGVFLVVDVAFFSANVLKIPAGGWVPLVIAAGVFLVMVVWRAGRMEVRLQLREHEPVPVERFIASVATHPQMRVPGTAVYMARSIDTTPPTLLRNLRANEVLHETVVLTEVSSANEPRIPQARRATVHDLGDGFFQVRLTYGFMERPDVPQALSDIVSSQFGFDPEDAVYFVGHETVIPTGHGIRRLYASLYAMLQRNVTGSSAYFRLPADKLFEVGVHARI